MFLDDAHPGSGLFGCVVAMGSSVARPGSAEGEKKSKAVPSLHPFHTACRQSCPTIVNPTSFIRTANFRSPPPSTNSSGMTRDATTGSVPCGTSGRDQLVTNADRGCELRTIDSAPHQSSGSTTKGPGLSCPVPPANAACPMLSPATPHDRSGNSGIGRA